MPIIWDEEAGWKIEKPTKEELAHLINIGKMMVVQGLAGAYTNQRYQEFLINAPDSRFHKV